MTPKVIHVERHATADRQTVWKLLDDSPGWVRWTPIDECEVLVAAEAGRHEIRRVHNGRVHLREEIVERVPERRLAYTVLSGLAVRDYLATIELADEADAHGPGTRIVWHTEFRAKVPGLGQLYLGALRQATQDFIEGLVTAAEQSQADR